MQARRLTSHAAKTIASITAHGVSPPLRPHSDPRKKAQTPMARNSPPSLASLLAQADHFIDPETGAVTPAIQPATTFARETTYALIGEHVYGRYGNPTLGQAEKVIAAAENAHEALLFSSGMAGFAAVIETLPTGSRVVAPRIMYHGGQDWLRRMGEKRDIKPHFFDAADPGALGAAIDDVKPQLVWIESPVNPTWDVIDIEAAASFAHDAGAKLAVDSTVAPPVTTRALDLGADLVFHSATKYLNGHSDVTAGCVAAREGSQFWDEIKYLRGYMGSHLAPFEAWLLLRGLRTLDVRYARACGNAMAIAEHFEGHRNVEAVLYPGLPSHPGHGIAKRQMTNGFGGMLSLLVKGGAEDALRVCARLELFVRATSLGGVESLVEHRATIEGPESAVPKNLLRLSVGIEAADDLIADLDAALRD